MEVYLLRHGKAEDVAPEMADRDRKLTPNGIESMKAELPGIKKRIPHLDYIFTSPFPRARETALIAASAFGLEDRMEDSNALFAAGAEEHVLEKLLSLPADAAVMLVGHSPLLDELSAFFTGPGHDVALKKGGLCRISFDGKPRRGGGTLQWELKPKELRAEE